MSARHLSMAELLAVRDADRSEPSFAMAHRHVEQCGACRHEADRLHQRRAQLRALAPLAPAVDVFPAVLEQLGQARAQRYWRLAGSVGVAAAAALVIWVVGGNLTAPPPLSAEDQIADVKSSTVRLEQRLKEWGPDQRAIDGGTVLVALELEDQLTVLKHKLQDKHRPDDELQLLREQEGLLTALLAVHVNRTVRIDL